MKIGDLVRWDNDRDVGVGGRPDTGIIVDGPRDSKNGRKGDITISYAVAWFDAKTTFWHNDYSLELLSEAR